MKTKNEPQGLEKSPDVKSPIIKSEPSETEKVNEDASKPQ